jgi:hypothetical protein
VIAPWAKLPRATSKTPASGGKLADSESTRITEDHADHGHDQQDGGEDREQRVEGEPRRQETTSGQIVFSQDRDQPPNRTEGDDAIDDQRYWTLGRGHEWFDGRDCPPETLAPANQRLGHSANL